MAVPSPVPSRQGFEKKKNGRRFNGRCRHGTGGSPSITTLRARIQIPEPSVRVTLKTTGIPQFGGAHRVVWCVRSTGTMGSSPSWGHPRHRPSMSRAICLRYTPLITLTLTPSLRLYRYPVRPPSTIPPRRTFIPRSLLRHPTPQRRTPPSIPPRFHPSPAPRIYDLRTAIGVQYLGRIEGTVNGGKGVEGRKGDPHLLAARCDSVASTPSELRARPHRSPDLSHSLPFSASATPVIK
ncbi:hypothetical protein B0H12DRAFT_1312854 [Mycena haematopus]|nr:hypothetical protein B0H12DRAFT_1312854 [Mycena haematopus]